jgi:hypothetical protein
VTTISRTFTHMCMSDLIDDTKCAHSNIRQNLLREKSHNKICLSQNLKYSQLFRGLRNGRAPFSRTDCDSLKPVGARCRYFINPLCVQKLFEAAVCYQEVQFITFFVTWCLDQYRLTFQDIFNTKLPSSEILCRVVLYKLTDVSEVFNCLRHKDSSL